MWGGDEFNCNIFLELIMSQSNYRPTMKYFAKERNNMDKGQKELKEFLEQQLEWTKEQAHILDQIDEKLHHMKKIAVYAAEYDLQDYEINELNRTLNRLKHEVHTLEKQFRGTVH